MKDQVPMSITEELIRAANPVPTSEVPPGDSPYARRLLAALPAAPARRRAVRPLGLALGGAAVAGLTAAIVAAVTITSPASPAGPAPLAGSLRDLVLAAARQPALQPGQFQYTETVAVNEVGTEPGNSSTYYNVDYDNVTQTWVGAGFSGRMVQVNTHPRFATPRDQARWARDGRPSLAEAPTDQTFGHGGLSDGPSVPIAQVPTNVAELTQQLTSRKLEGGPPGAVESFIQAGDMLRATGAPPALRAALFQVAAHLPGVRVLPHATNHDGRPGIALAIYSKGEGAAAGTVGRHELIFDPATSALIGEDATDVNPSTLAPAGIDNWTVYVKSFIVGSTSSTTPVSPASGS
jgi:hypothetical protein